MRQSLSELTDKRIQRDPEAPALLAPDLRPLRYRELGEQINYAASILRANGIARDDRVAVVLPNGADMAAVFLAVGSHAACAPLNPGFREEEFEFYLSDLRAKAILLPRGTDTPARTVAARQGIAILEIIGSTDRQAGKFRVASEGSAPRAAPDPGGLNDVALMLHTSGTTSRPKLVPLTHVNLLTSAHNVCDSLALTARDRCLNVMPLFHIHGLVAALLSSVVAGGSVICTPGYDAGFFRWLTELSPTWYSAVPTIHQSVLAAAQENDPAANSLRLIRSSSAPLPPSVMDGLQRTFDVPVVEAYGMTEAAHQMAANPLPPKPRKPGSVGPPAGPDMAVMDDAGNLLDADESGEIVIRGDNVTSGYVGDPEANTQAFTQGWFRTGDLGRRDADGYYWLTGRTREIVNRGGENVSPREIDEALLEHDSVVQAVAFGVPHERLGEDLVAAVILAPDATIDAQALREFTIDRLADYKVPSQILIVADIPKGPTGKLQRIGLHEKLAHLLRGEFVEPQSTAEVALAEMWAELLEVLPVSAMDNFFGMGGDSLLAMRLLARINDRFALALDVQCVFVAPVLSAQARLIENELIREIRREGI